MQVQAIAQIMKSARTLDLCHCSRFRLRWHYEVLKVVHSYCWAGRDPVGVERDLAQIQWLAHSHLSVDRSVHRICRRAVVEEARPSANHELLIAAYVPREAQTRRKMVQRFGEGAIRSGRPPAQARLFTGVRTRWQQLQCVGGTGIVDLAHGRPDLQHLKAALPVLCMHRV